MKIAYLDCFSGISGDMMLGALVDAGLPLEVLQTELSKLKLGGYELSAEKTQRHAISATKVNVTLTQDQPTRHLHDIVTIIEESGLSDTTKSKTNKIFKRLAEAEAKVHDSSPEKVHFHEVGMTDAIVDVVGAVIGLEHLGVQEIYASPLRIGTGFVKSQHGTLPVPAPATAELIQNIPTHRTRIESELVTPTGAAIITILAHSFHDLPLFTSEAVGYGAGSRELQEIPNLLRIEIGTRQVSLEEDQSVVIETNIDDMNPEIYSHLVEKLLAEGAQDVYLSQVIMKKSRPGIMLSVLVEPAQVNRMSILILQETTTLGLRIYTVKRLKAKRKTTHITTEYGPIQVKVAEINGQRRVTPEFDDCRRIAIEKNIPILKVYDIVNREVSSLLDLKT